jgi:sugar/nucleoside kinase (ribokinase family)
VVPTRSTGRASTEPTASTSPPATRAPYERPGAARILVATPRAGEVLAGAGVALDSLVYSANDELEADFARAVEPRPALLVATEGPEGGQYETSDALGGVWSAAEPPGPIADAYGSGDTFAGALDLRADRRRGR